MEHDLDLIAEKVKRYRKIALAGYFSLFLMLMLNVIWLLPPDNKAITAMVLLVLVGPMLFPLKGILHGRHYTHAWASYLALFYVLHGVWEVAGNMDNWLPGSLETATAIVMFYGCILYARFAKRFERVSEEQASKPSAE